MLDNDMLVLSIAAAELPNTISYSAFSHVRGKAPFLTTTRATFNAIKTSITLEPIPSNFRDAVKVNRGFDTSG
jgi:hypothetical protein